MPEVMKTFKVHCAHCSRPFHVRFPLARPDAEGKGRVVVVCQYCSENVTISIPRTYIEEDHLVRRIPSDPSAEEERHDP